MGYFDINLDNDISYLLQEIGYNCKINNVDAKAIINNTRQERTHDDKVIITNEKIQRGDYVSYADLNFIVLPEINAKRYNTYYKGIIRRCNYNIKFIIDDKLYLFYSIIEGQNFSIEQGQFFNMQGDAITVTLPETPITKQIKRQQRFIKFGSAWEIQGIDYTQDGLIKLNCKIATINENVDDAENEIANRYNAKDNTDVLNGNIIPILPFDGAEEPVEPSDEYFVTITNKIDTLPEGETYQLDITAKYGNYVIENPALTYISSDDTIATISSTGLITAKMAGNVTITVRFEDAEDTITLKVEEVQQGGGEITIQIEGNPTLSSWDGGTYTARVFVDGAEDNTKTVTFSVKQEVDNNKINIVSQDGHSCTLQSANKENFGFFTLVATLDEDNSIIAEKKIELTLF